MPQWEYQVIHLNVDPGKGGESTKGQNLPPPFTQSYLEQEFPEHYRQHQSGAGVGAGSGGAPPPQHPAKQLQNFLNGHGAQGWNLVGIFPLGPLLMMVMRRRSGGEPQAEPNSPEPSVAKRQEQGDSKPQEPGLQELLNRIEALERRLPPPVSSSTGTSPASSAAPAAPGPGPSPAVPLEEGNVLDPATLETLAAEPSLSAREAAEALGYRSTASLSNLGSRAGYPIGLVKLGVNGKVAVYRGVSPGSSGGRAQRHWVVVKLSRLER